MVGLFIQHSRPVLYNARMSVHYSAADHVQRAFSAAVMTSSVTSLPGFIGSRSQNELSADNYWIAARCCVRAVVERRSVVACQVSPLSGVHGRRLKWTMRAGTEFQGANYKKISRLSYDVIITYDYRKYYHIVR